MFSLSNRPSSHHPWLTAKRWLGETRSLWHRCGVFLNDFERNHLIWTKCSKQWTNTRMHVDLFLNQNICNDLERCLRFRGHTVAIFTLINPSLFTSVNPVGNARILRDCDEHLRSAKGLPLVTQAGSGGPTSLFQLYWGGRRKSLSWRVSIHPKVNVIAHTFEALC